MTRGFFAAASSASATARSAASRRRRDSAGAGGSNAASSRGTTGADAGAGTETENDPDGTERASVRTPFAGDAFSFPWTSPTASRPTFAAAATARRFSRFAAASFSLRIAFAAAFAASARAFASAASSSSSSRVAASNAPARFLPTHLAAEASRRSVFPAETFADAGPFAVKRATPRTDLGLVAVCCLDAAGAVVGVARLRLAGDEELRRVPLRRPPARARRRRRGRTRALTADVGVRGCAVGAVGVRPVRVESVRVRVPGDGLVGDHFREVAHHGGAGACLPTRGSHAQGAREASSFSTRDILRFLGSP